MGAGAVSFTYIVKASGDQQSIFDQSTRSQIVPTVAVYLTLIRIHGQIVGIPSTHFPGKHSIYAILSKTWQEMPVEGIVGKRTMRARAHLARTYEYNEPIPSSRISTVKAVSYALLLGGCHSQCRPTACWRLARRPYAT
jgi:hypothetical protein